MLIDKILSKCYTETNKALRGKEKWTLTSKLNLSSILI